MPDVITGVTATARRSLRALHVLLHIGTGFVVAFALGGFFSQHRPAMQRATRWWLARLLRILRVEVTVSGAPPACAALFVSNHVSWLDIPVLGGVAGVHFLSKAEVAAWPLIGPLATAAGTLYIRRGHGQVRERARQIAAHISAGRPVLVFPEGTTTDGSDVRSFHSPLFAAASNDGHPVQPVAIRYLDERGQPHPCVPFVDDDEFTAHLWRLLGDARVRVEVQFLPPLHGHNPQLLAGAAHAMVRGAVLAGRESSVPGASVVAEPVQQGLAGEFLASRT